MSPRTQLPRLLLVCALLLGPAHPALRTSHLARRSPHSAPRSAHLGYGVNTNSSGDYARTWAMGFNWVKSFDVPAARLPEPMKFLYRISVHAGTTPAEVDAQLQPAFDHPGRVDAYEIGNEPNTDSEWQGPPDPNGYLAKLQYAAGRIRQSDPTAVIVSAGLAPVGRIQGQCTVGSITYNGNNCSGMDDQLYAAWLFEHGAGAYFDAFGYHNYGFAYPPGLDPHDPQVWPNAFVFRGAELIHDIMVQHGLGYKQVWTTEFGWLIDPDLVHPELGCKTSRPEWWTSRLWYLVSPATQAQYLADAYAYADANWPWMGALVVFNLNFAEAPWHDDCEPMKYFSLYDLDATPRPAVAALTAIPKQYGDFRPAMAVAPPAVTLQGDPDEDLSTSAAVLVTNTQPFGTFLWSAAPAPGAFTPVISPTAGVAGGGFSVWTSPHGLPLGTHAGAVTVTAGLVGGQVANTPQVLGITLVVAEHEILAAEPGVMAFVVPLGATGPVTSGVNIVNRGAGAFDWTAEILPGGQITPALTPAGGHAGEPLWGTLDVTGFAAGLYTTTLRITANHGAQGSPLDVPVRLAVAPVVYRVYLPVLVRGPVQRARR